jgi:hypothetical protein
MQKNYHASIKKLPKVLLILPNAASAVMRRFPKAASNHMNSFQKAADVSNYFSRISLLLVAANGNQFL